MKITHDPKNPRPRSWCLDARPSGRKWFETEGEARRAYDRVEDLQREKGINLSDAFGRLFGRRLVLTLPVGAQAPWREEYRVRLWAGAKARADRAGIPFEISVEDLVIPERCPALGIVLLPHSQDRSRDQAPSLDRIRPELGYVRGNVAVISWRANRLKSNATPDELRGVADWLDFESRMSLGSGAGLSLAEETPSNRPLEAKLEGS